MRICISGCAGIGKSTLAGGLASRLGVDFIGENYRPFFHPPGQFKAPPEQLAQIFQQVLAHKSNLEDQAGKFVVDRGGIDLFNLWMARRLNRFQQASRIFQENCRKRAQTYDLVVFPPWGSIPLVPHQGESDGRVRVQNPWVQLHNHATMAGLAKIWLPDSKVLHIPSEVSDPEQRVGFVIEHLNLPR